MSHAEYKVSSLIIILVVFIDKTTCTTPSQVSLGISKFNNKLFDEIVKNSEDNNVFFSPISAHLILSLLYQGSKGDTKKVLSDVLNIPEPSITADNYKEIMSQLQNLRNVTINVANKIWVKDGLKLKSSFKSLAIDKFYAEADSNNFNDNEVAIKTINDWVEKKTDHKIKDFVKSEMIDPLTAMVLVNAIYFKGDWAVKFDKSRTRKRPFFITEKQSVDVDMMNVMGVFRFGINKDLNAQILELPYGNGDVSMLIILPFQRFSIQTVQEKIVTKDWTKLINNLAKETVSVSLPKFKIETTIDLKNILSNMGLDIIFSEKADFSDFLDKPTSLKVSKAIQKTLIEVNEDGSQIAAATGTTTVIRSSESLNVNHPFIVAVLHNNNLLFAGRIINPSI